MTVAEGRVDWSPVTDWFGYLPRFHDSEIISLELNREPRPSILRVYAFSMNTDIDARGHYRLDKHCLVTFELEGIQEQVLEYWNHQNAMMSIEVTEVGEWLRLELEGSYGVGGHFLVRNIRVALEPWSERLAEERGFTPGHDPAA